MIATEIKKTSLAAELEASAIAHDLTLNFTNISGASAWDYLFYSDSKEIRTNNGKLCKKWLDNYAHIDDGGWWCGTLDIVNEGRSSWGCFKAKSPRLNKDGKPIKYEHPPKEPTQPFFLEILRDRWERIANLHGLTFPELSDIPPSADPFEFWRWVRENPSLPIIITEGAKKTASILSASYCAVGVSGIWNGSPKELAGDGTPLDKKLNEQLQAIATEGREIIFCFDNDTKAKTVAAVTKATESLAKLFEAAGCTTSVMYWRGIYEEKGIDDVHAAHGSDAIDQLFGDRLPVAAWLEAMSKPLLKDPSKAPKVEAVTTTPLQPVVTYLEAEDPDAPMPIEEEEEPKKPPSLTYQEVALQALYLKGHYTVIGNKLYKFNGKFYEPQSEVKERRRIHDWASSYVIYDSKGKRSYGHLKPASIQSIWDWVLERLRSDDDEINPPGFNFDNGILRLTWVGREPKWNLHPHSPKEKYLYCSKVKYDPKADPEMCNRLFAALEPHAVTVLMRNLSGVFDIDKIRTLHGRILRAGFAVGSGANGKDTFRDIVMLLFPERVVSLPLTKFLEYDQGNLISLRKLENAWVNWSTENNKETPLDKIECLNFLISGEKGTYEVKELYANPNTKEEAPKAVYLFNCNNPPIIKSGLKSLQSRVVVYNFNKTFVPDPNPAKGELLADPRFKYDEQFQIEQIAPAFLNRMIEEFGNLAREGIDYEPLEKGILDLREKSTHLWSFVEDVGLEEDEHGEVWLSELWEKLEEWYLDNGTLEKRELYDGSFKRIWNDQPLRFDPNVTGMNQVFNRLQKLFPNITKAKATNDPLNKNKTFIKGISFNSASLPHNPVTATNSALPSGSLCLTNNESGLPNIPPSLSNENGEKRGGKAGSKAESKAAVSQKSLNIGDCEAGKAEAHKRPHDLSNGSVNGDRPTLPPAQEFLMNEIALYSRTRAKVRVVALPDFASLRDETYLYRCEFVDNPLTEKMIAAKDLIKQEVR